MEKIDGKLIAKNIIEDLKMRPVPDKIFAAVIVGENSVSENFLKQKENSAKDLGVDFRVYRFPNTITNDELRKEVGKISALKKVGGVIVQLPLPRQINKFYILNAISREKDVDVLGERALGAFYNQRNKILPPAVAALNEILKIKNYDLSFAKVAVVGLGFLIGKPISLWLEGKCKELNLLDKNSSLDILKEVDLIILGAGVPGLIKADMLKNNAIVIDFGCAVVEGKIKGDFDYDVKYTTCDAEQGFYTPTPGGTGPVLVAKIMQNFYDLNE